MYVAPRGGVDTLFYNILKYIYKIFLNEATNILSDTSLGEATGTKN